MTNGETALICFLSPAFWLIIFCYFVPHIMKANKDKKARELLIIKNMETLSQNDELLAKMMSDK